MVGGAPGDQASVKARGQGHSFQGAVLRVCGRPVRAEKLVILKIDISETTDS